MISILLASCNGDKYIREQIDSLLKQSVQDFKLFINDDKSTDDTFSIISEYAGSYPDKVFIAQNAVNSGGAKNNFIKMMISHKDDYVMLCDQDDIWKPNKIEKSLAKIKEMEAQYGESKPLLVHTDLTLVDEKLEIIAPSYMKKTKARFERNKLNNLLIHNILTGCSVMYNRALAKLLSAEPDYMIMHDWWIGLVASTFGEIGAVYEPTVLYRQHDSNEFGANRRNPVSHLFHKLFHFREVRETLSNTYRQAGSFSSLYSERLPRGLRELVAAYASIPQKKRTDRLRILFRYGIWKDGFIRRSAQILAVI